MKRLLWIPALVGSALVCAGVDQGSGLRKSWQLRSDLRAAERRIAALHDEVRELGAEAQQLEDDAFAIERAIREDLGLARPGETLVRLAPALEPTP